MEWRKCIYFGFTAQSRHSLLVVWHSFDSFATGCMGACNRVSGLGCEVYASPFKAWFPRFDHKKITYGAGQTESVRICGILERMSNLPDEEMDAALKNLTISWNPDLVKEVVQGLRDPKLAFRYFIWLSEKGGYHPTHIEYNAMLEIMGFAKMFKYMRTLFWRMKESKCRISCATYTILIRCYGNAGRVTRACEALMELNASCRGPNLQAYNCLLESFVKLGRIDSGLLVFKEIQNLGMIPNEFTISILTKGLCTAGRLQEAWDILRAAPFVNNICYNVLLRGFCDAKRMDDSFTIWDEMKAKGLVSDVYTYNALIVGSCKAGRLDEALNLRKEMVEKGIPRDAITNGTLIRFLCKDGREDEAYKVLETMMSEGDVLTGNEYWSLHCLFSGTRNSSEAELLLNQMNKGNSRSINQGHP
eukprot:c18715_g1_i1 orf=382-1635(+)